MKYDTKSEVYISYLGTLLEPYEFMYGNNSISKKEAKERQRKVDKENYPVVTPEEFTANRLESNPDQRKLARNKIRYD